MDIISIPQLRLGQLQSLAESTLTIVDPIAVVADAKDKVQAAFGRFKEGMKKESAESNKKTLDKVRDRLVSGFMFAIKSEEYYPQDTPQKQESLRRLKRILGKYGFKINKLQYDEQTSAIVNMLDEVEKIELTGLEHLSRWVPRMKAANEDFKAGSEDYLEGTVSEASTESASATAPALLDALEDLYTMLFAHAKVSGDDQIVQAYHKISVLVDSYR